jgi:tetratricopeptide (TPR) repeat protein
LARSLFLRAAKNNPQSPAAVAGLGSLALAENRNADAEREFERAIAMGYRDAGAYFELAKLKNDNALLEKALTLDPKFAMAHFLLGVRATDNGNFAAAIDHLREAVAIEPRAFTCWHALGYAQAKSGDRQAAAESARRVAILASTEQEEKMAAALTLLASETPAVRGTTPRVITPSSWQNRRGDARAEGTLTWVHCDSSPVRLDIATQTPARTIELNVQNPDEVELHNAEGLSTTLVCGEQSRPVVIEYVSATRKITRIEFQHVIIKR